VTKRSKRMLVVGGAALAVVGGGGAALAAGGNPLGGSNDRQAVIDDAAQRLNVKPSELQSALKQAMLDRIDAALEARRITQQQADELKARVKAGDGLGPLFGPPGGPGHGFHHGGPPIAGLDAAATYLGLTEAQLHEQLDSGKTLAQIAKAQGKSTDGLKQAMLAGAKTHLDADVKAGKLTQAQADKILADLSSRLDNLIQNGFGFHHGGPPIAGLDAAATYLGLTPAQLRTQLQSGKTLAQVAKAQGKSTDGLKQAMLADAKKHLDAAVKAGKLTQSQADQAFAEISSRLDDLIQNGFRFRDHDGDHSGGAPGKRGFWFHPAGGPVGPPPTAPAAA
jgi:urease accessory protein UreF